MQNNSKLHNYGSREIFLIIKKA